MSTDVQAEDAKGFHKPVHHTRGEVQESSGLQGLILRALCLAEHTVSRTRSNTIGLCPNLCPISRHSVFAELFCEAIKNGLPALQVQHPGIYYQKAAEYVIKRRVAAKEACEIYPSEGSSPGLTQSNLYTEFFGIRAVKTGDPVAEQQANVQICELERNFNHSAAIIALLSQAMAQFKIYKCLRFRKKLAIDMAEEYLKSGDHGKALT